MNTSLEFVIDDFFKGYGLKLINPNTNLHINIPTKEDLEMNTLANTPYDQCEEDVKVRIINEFICKKNCLRISDYKLFLPNLKFNNQEEGSVEYIFKTVSIIHSNESQRIIFRTSITNQFKSLFNTRDYFKNLSNEFQMKAIFSPVDKLNWQFRREVKKLVINRLIELNIIEKMNVEIPTLIMNHLDKMKK